MRIWALTAQLATATSAPTNEPLSELPELMNETQSKSSEPTNEPLSKPLSEPPGLLAPTTCRITRMIAAKNYIVTTVTAATTIGRKARGPSNFINADQITPYAADQTFCLKLSHALIFF